MKSATTSALLVDFSTNDPKLAELLKTIEALPRHSSCRHEMEATLYGFLHDKSIREAEQWRRIEQGQKVRKAQLLARRLKREAVVGNSN